MTHTEALFKTIILLHHLAELHKKDNVDLYYIDLFCGAGGTSTGEYRKWFYCEGYSLRQPR